jgi:predicted ester cyclase
MLRRRMVLGAAIAFVAIIMSSALVVGVVIVSEAHRSAVIPEPSRNVDPAEQERNKLPVRQLYEEMFSKGRYELMDQAFAKNCPVHFGSRSESLAQAIDEGKQWRQAAPDLNMAINDIKVNGDIVTVVWTGTGTHTGHGHGLKPTGKRVSLHGTSRFRVVNGKIVEAWNEEYRPQLFKQLGIPRTAAVLYLAANDFLSAITQLTDRWFS